MSDHERLYRDESRAALERVAQLAAENEELKRELARYRDGRDVPTLRTRQRGLPGYAVAACAASATLLFAGIASCIVFAAVEPASEAPLPVIEVPTRAAVTPFERSAMPRRWKDEQTKCADETPARTASAAADIY